MGPPSVGFTTRKVAAVQFQKAENERLKREDCHRVKHDKLFSDWKILVGSSDWRSHAAEEEGAQRYRLHNLPATYFGPGVYELGLTLQNLSAPREARPRKIRKQDVVVVYLGQAENVRQRLQKYGQSGSHLEGARLVSGSAVEDCEYDQKTSPSKVRAKTDGSSTGGSTERGLRLFTEVFSRGHSIVFRWARTESKQMAEKVESELLHVFDYPWNRGLNGARRPDDILARLELMQYHLEQSLCLGRLLGAGVEKWKYFHRKVGIKVPLKRPSEERSSDGSRFAIFRASSKDGLPHDGSKPGNTLCGVLLEDGLKCSKAPVKGRRRCVEHKGVRAKLTTRRARAVKSKTSECGGNVSNHTKAESYSSHTGNPPVLIVKTTPNGKRLEFSDAPTDGLVCGVTLDNGGVCLNSPAKDRKRCAAHKGMRTGGKSSGSPITIQPCRV